MLLTGLSVALSKNDSCKIAQAGIRNAEKKTFQTKFIKTYTWIYCHFIDFLV